MLKHAERGQALLESLVVIATLLLAVGVAAAAVRTVAVNRHPQSARLAALEAAQNAVSEILAATAYDRDAVAHLGAAQWFAGTTNLSLVPAQASGSTRAFVLHYKGSGLEGDLPFSVRSVAPPPGSIIDPRATQSP